jgi:PHD/YefM family antitoxin component YafN of YafNO toxin-antitoxin module
MLTCTVTDARKNWSDLISTIAFKGERVLLRRNGKDIGAIVPAEDLQLLEALEDSLDLKEALKRLADNKTPISYEQIRAELGLD